MIILSYNNHIECGDLSAAQVQVDKEDIRDEMPILWS